MFFGIQAFPVFLGFAVKIRLKKFFVLNTSDARLCVLAYMFLGEAS